MRPYSLVESEAFRRLNFVDPSVSCQCNLKSKKYFRTTLMPQTYKRVKMQVANLISKSDWFNYY